MGFIFMKIEFHFLSSSIMYGGKRNCQVRLRRRKPITYAYLLDSFFRGHIVKQNRCPVKYSSQIKTKNLGSFYLFLRSKFVTFPQLVQIRKVLLHVCVLYVLNPNFDKQKTKSYSFTIQNTHL